MAKKVTVEQYMLDMANINANFDAIKKFYSEIKKLWSDLKGTTASAQSSADKTRNEMADLKNQISHALGLINSLEQFLGVKFIETKTTKESAHYQKIKKTK